MVSTVTAPPKVNLRDVRNTKLWRDVSKHFDDLYSPAFGKVSDASDVELSPDGRNVSFTGTIWTKLQGLPAKRICVADVATGKTDVITSGPNNDQQAKWCPAGRSIAFLSDRAAQGTFHLYLLTPGHLGEAKPVRLPRGMTAEYAAWSPTGVHILIGAAGQGADQAGSLGSGTLESAENELPDWMPIVEPDAQNDPWRAVFVYDVASEVVCRVSRVGLNVWEAAWCGPAHIVVVASSGPTESSWYYSNIELLDVHTRASQTIYRSSVQLGIPSASPSGTHVAFVEGLFSDRGVIAGTPLVVNVASQSSNRLDTEGVDASQLSWIDEQNLFFIGLRGLHAVAGQINIETGQVERTWMTPDGLGVRYPQASQVVDGNFAVACSSWTKYPEIGLVRGAVRYQTLASLEHEGATYLRSVCGPIEEIAWSAPDGTQIQGYLCRPQSAATPYPLVLHVHGGPIWAFTNSWQLKFPFVPILVAHGYAVLSVNPRGSRGRGDDFANKVRGDMGGAEVEDLLSGIDALVETGVADPSRLGVMGGSHGGYISTWITTRTKRFAASVAVAPVTDWYSQHTASNIPAFDQIMLQDDPYTPTGAYHDRSPLRFVKNCSTPVMQLVGSEDRCTPALQALQFHNALVEHGVDTVVVRYPGEGHGTRKFPGVIDFCYRMLSWFDNYMPA